MKTLIADFMYRFWLNNHTYSWVPFTPMFDEKCEFCGVHKKSNS